MLTIPSQLSRLFKSRLFLNISVLGASTVIGKLIGLFNLGYIARAFGPENYGMIGFGTSVVAYAGILLSPGLMTWGTRDVARHKENAGETVISINLIQVALAVLGFGLLLLFSHFFIHDEKQRMIVILCGLQLFQTALSIEWAFNGIEHSRVPAALSVISSAALSLCLILFIKNPTDIYLYLVLNFAILTLFVLVSYLIFFRHFKVRFSGPNLKSVRKAFIQSLPLNITTALVVILHYANNLIVKYFLGSNALGEFLAAFRLLELTNTIPGLLGTVFLPRIARLKITDLPVAKEEARLFGQINMILAFIIAPLILAESEAVILVVFGTQFLSAAYLLGMMTFAMVFNFAICGYTNVLISFGEDRVMLKIVIVSAAVSILGGLLLVPIFGVLGASIAICCIDIAGWMVSMPTYRRIIGPLGLNKWMRPILAGCFLIGLSFVLKMTDIPMWSRLIAEGIVAVFFMAFFLIRLAKQSALLKHS